MNDRFAKSASATLRVKVEARAGLVVPGVANPLSALVAQDLGFEALYVTGAGVTNTNMGLPDLGFIGADTLADVVAAIGDVVDLPLIVDCDTGFGNAVNVYQTVRRLERAGSSAIQIEDQIMPKKCGHFSGKGIVPAGEMVGKIKAAADARHDPDVLIIARTDARETEGFDAAMERAHLYAEAGADLLFVEAPESVEEIRAIPERLAVPQIMNVVVGGKTPALNVEDLAAMRYGIVLYANLALQGAVLGMKNALSLLKKDGIVQESSGVLAGFSERQRLVRKSYYDELERRYAAAD